MVTNSRLGSSAAKDSIEMQATGVQQIAVIIPALNEEKSIQLVLQSIPRNIVSQIIVVDNGSTDRTSEFAILAGAQVVHETRRGYGSACLSGIRNLRAGTDMVVFLDADFSDFPEELQILVRPILEDRADLVLGTRMHDRQTRATLTVQQRFGNWLSVRLISYFWGWHYTDLGPFRAIRRRSLEMLSMGDRNFGWTVEMQIKAGLAGLRTLEIPVHYRPRIGRSKVSGTVKGTILAGAKILFTIFRYALRTRFRRTD